MNIYLIPGLGTDDRVFNNLTFDSNYTTHHIKLVLPEEGSSMADYARQLSTQIDTTTPFILIGTSLGGMLATEMADFLEPEKVIILASAKTAKELPYRYRVQQKLPLKKVVSGNMIKSGTLFLQPIVEPQRNNEKETFISMLVGKDPVFMKRAVDMIIKWDRTTYRKDIIHIHGNKDKTIPIRNVRYDYLIRGGSHVMTLAMAEEVNKVLAEVL
jgi:esterase/lipase